MLERWKIEKGIFDETKSKRRNQELKLNNIFLRNEAYSLREVVEQLAFIKGFSAKKLEKCVKPTRLIIQFWTL